MKLKQIFNTTEENIKSKKHNIFIPICLKNKFFSEKNILTENVENYLNWALDNTKEKVLFLVVDKIQDTNYFVRNSSNSEDQNLRRVLKDGKEVKKNLVDLISKFPEKEKIKIVGWEDYEKEDPFYGQTTHLVYKEFKNNNKFRDKVLETIRTSITDRKFSEEKYWKLCDYILDEFSLCYSGIQHEGINYDLFPYPRTDSTSDFIHEIQNGEIFPKLNKKLPKEKVAWTILNNGF